MRFLGVKAGIDVFVPFRKYQLKPQSPWFAPARSVAITFSGYNNVIVLITTGASLSLLVIIAKVSSMRTKSLFADRRRHRIATHNLVLVTIVIVS